MIWDEMMSDMTNMTYEKWTNKTENILQPVRNIWLYVIWIYILTSDFQMKQIYIDVFLSTNISKLRI